METQVFVVSECCPVGCRFDVLLLRTQGGGMVFAYCEGCGCTWTDPRAARFGRGIDEVKPPYALTQEAVELPSRHEVMEAGFENLVLRTKPVSDAWKAIIEKINGEIRRKAMPTG